MKIITSILLSFFLLCIANVSLAQQTEEIEKDSTKTDETEVGKKYMHAFGVGAGFTTGLGFTYRLMPNKFGVQFRLLPYKDSYDFFLSSAVTFRYNVYEGKKSNLFLYQGNHFIYKEDYPYNYDYYDYYTGSYVGYTSQTQTSFSYSTAVGLGIEFLMGKRFTTNMMFGYGAHNNFKVIAPSIETGMFFKF